MLTEKQALANRANAQRSTGPKSEAGKRKSSLNRLTHGLTAQTIVIGDEDPAKFDELKERLNQEFQPETAIELFLVERLAMDTWRLLRIPVFEAAYMEFYFKSTRAHERRFNSIDPTIPEDEYDEPGAPTLRKMALWFGRSHLFHDALAKLSRYEKTLLNSFNRTLESLIAFKERSQKKTLLEAGADLPSTPGPQP